MYSHNKTIKRKIKMTFKLKRYFIRKMYNLIINQIKKFELSFETNLLFKLATLKKFHKLTTTYFPTTNTIMRI